MDKRLRDSPVFFLLVILPVCLGTLLAILIATKHQPSDDGFISANNGRACVIAVYPLRSSAIVVLEGVNTKARRSANINFYWNDDYSQVVVGDVVLIEPDGTTPGCDVKITGLSREK